MVKTECKEENLKFQELGSRAVEAQFKGKALVGKSTLNRLELRSDNPEQDGRYKKIAVEGAAVDKFFVKVFRESFSAISHKSCQANNSRPRCYYNTPCFLGTL